MITDLPEGTLFTYKYRGEWAYGRITVAKEDCIYKGKVLGKAGEKRNMLISEDSLTEGETLHVCVWKGRGTDKRLESRRVIKYKKPQQHLN